MHDHDGTSAPDRDGDGFTRARVDDLAAAYRRREPFDLVEREHVETLPPAFAAGEFGRRDAEWVVQWYYRRRSLPDAERRAAEARFEANDYETLVEAIRGATAATTLEAKLDRSTALDGVDVAVASGFLAFSHPDRFVAVGDREWRALHAAGELTDARPDPLTPAAYRTYLETVRTVADRTGRDPWTVYRAVWRAGEE
jgi:hypothetical protein